MTSSSVVLVGVGELGGVFARGLLRLGHPVVPITRNQRSAEVAQATPEPELVLITVGEDDLEPVLRDLPTSWRGSLGFVQNELLPYQWEATASAPPTVAIVWFEKKPGREVHVVVPSVLSGPKTSLLGAALDTLCIPWRAVGNGGELMHELVLKNLYILCLNLCGLETGGLAGELLTKHRELFVKVREECLELQRALLGSDGQTLDDSRLFADLRGTIEADPGHGCAGRTAKARLGRCLDHAARLGLELPTLKKLSATHGAGGS